MRITEYVGKSGVRSSTFDHDRASHPRPGDLVLWIDGTYGMIESIGKWADNEAQVCSNQGSAFLGEGYISISGGPFFSIPLAELEPAPMLGLHAAHFWNWGDNQAGASMGVDYTLMRPVFRYTGDPEHTYTHRSPAPVDCELCGRHMPPFGLKVCRVCKQSFCEECADAANLCMNCGEDERQRNADMEARMAAIRAERQGDL